MIEQSDVRESRPTDAAAIEDLYTAAFPDEELRPLVRKLLAEESIVLSLVGTADGTLAGHGMFTTCGLSGTSEKVALLGPLAVAPTVQRQGVGSAIVRAGLKRLENGGTSQVYVLGDPAYYRRFGFAPDNDVAPPYSLPEEWRGAWQSINLSGGEPPHRGKLLVPEPWRDPALWGP